MPHDAHHTSLALVAVGAVVLVYYNVIVFVVDVVESRGWRRCCSRLQYAELVEHLVHLERDRSQVWVPGKERTPRLKRWNVDFDLPSTPAGGFQRSSADPASAAAAAPLTWWVLRQLQKG